MRGNEQGSLCGWFHIRFSSIALKAILEKQFFRIFVCLVFFYSVFWSFDTSFKTTYEKRWFNSGLWSLTEVSYRTEYFHLHNSRHSILLINLIDLWKNTHYNRQSFKTCLKLVTLSSNINGSAQTSSSHDEPWSDLVDVHFYGEVWFVFNQRVRAGDRKRVWTPSNKSSPKLCTFVSYENIEPLLCCYVLHSVLKLRCLFLAASERWRIVSCFFLSSECQLLLSLTCSCAASFYSSLQMANSL